MRALTTKYKEQGEGGKTETLSFGHNPARLSSQLKMNVRQILRSLRHADGENGAFTDSKLSDVDIILQMTKIRKSRIPVA